MRVIVRILKFLNKTRRLNSNSKLYEDLEAQVFIQREKHWEGKLEGEGGGGGGESKKR